MTVKFIDDLIEKYFEKINTYRKYLHTIPELAYEEHETSKYIRNVLKELEIPYKEYGTGTVGIIEGEYTSKTYAFRTDIDALPVIENTTGIEKSKYEGRMHACGHDAHMSSVLGLATILKLENIKPKYNVLFIFQPAEESGAGADYLIKNGLFDDFKIDEIYGTHVWPTLERGKYGTAVGSLMAMAGEIDIKIETTPAHGAMPHLGIDAVVVATNLIQQIQSIVSRNIEPKSPAVFTVGRVEAGEKRNIIAKEAKLECTIRAYEEDVYQKMLKRLDEICKGLEIAFNAKISYNILSQYPNINNDADLVDELLANVQNAILTTPTMAAEDFSFYQRKTKGLFVFVGIRDEVKGYVHSLHSDKFDIDPELLKEAPRLFLNILRYKGVIN